MKTTLELTREGYELASVYENPYLMAAIASSGNLHAGNVTGIAYKRRPDGKLLELWGTGEPSPLAPTALYRRWSLMTWTWV